MISEDETREVKRRHSMAILSRPGVCGFGVEKDASGQCVLVIHVNTDDSEIQKQLPTQIENISVKVVRSGPFTKQEG